MKAYKLIKNIDPMILLCSEKTEFEALGYDYIEHHLFDNKRVLENTLNRRCIEFFYTLSDDIKGYYTVRILSDSVDIVGSTLIINTETEALYFNASLTRRKSKLLVFIKAKIQSEIRRYRRRSGRIYRL